MERGTRMAFDSGRPIAHVARDLGIHPETLRKRVRQTEADEGKRTEPCGRVFVAWSTNGDPDPV